MLLSVLSRPNSPLSDLDHSNCFAHAITALLGQLTLIAKGLARLLAHHGEGLRVVVVRAGSMGCAGIKGARKLKLDTCGLPQRGR